nr:LysR family transcriptional regulator [Lactobacillus amylolyticus]
MFNQIQYFIAVVKNKNFTKAAEECHISQPAISQQIKELEANLGVELLHRKGRSFTVTKAGQYFYHHGQDVIDNFICATSVPLNFYRQLLSFLRLIQM